MTEGLDRGLLTSEDDLSIRSIPTNALNRQRLIGRYDETTQKMRMPPKQAVWEALRKNLNIKFEAHTTLKKGFNLHLYDSYRLTGTLSR